MAFILQGVFPANGTNNFKIEDRIKLQFNMPVRDTSINSGTVVLYRRDNGDVVNIDFVVKGDLVEIYPSVALSEETGYRLIVAGKDLMQPAGFVHALDDTEFIYTQTILFTTTTREQSQVINLDKNDPQTESHYVLGPGNTPTLVDTLKLKLLYTTPELGEMMVSPAFLNENGIRLTFNRPVDIDSAKKYVKLSHLPLAGIRGMAYDKNQLLCSFSEASEQNYCLDSRNTKLKPNMNYYIQGNDLLLTYPDTQADIDAQSWVDPGVGISSSGLAPFNPVYPPDADDPIFDYIVHGELTEETHAFNFQNTTTLYLTYETHVIKDRYLVYQGNKFNPIYDSGCVGTDGLSVTIPLTIMPNVPFYVTVRGGCDSNELVNATAWHFRVSNFDPNVISSSSQLYSSSSNDLSSSSPLSSSSLISSSSEDFIPSSSSGFASSSMSSSSSSSSGCAENWGGPVLNAEVRIALDNRLKSLPDNHLLTTTLEEDINIYFLMGMFPIYADIDMIRLTLDNLNRKHDDEQILRIILKNSLDAWRMACYTFDLCDPNDAAITYAEAKTSLDIYDMTFIGNLSSRGKSESLGDFSYRLSARESNNRRNSKESDTSNIVNDAARELKSACGTNSGILWLVKGRTNCTTKPNFRTRTYKYLSPDSGWIFPSIKNHNRYVELPNFGDHYS